MTSVLILKGCTSRLLSGAAGRQTGSSPRLNLDGGVRRACPTSPDRFLICAQLLCHLIQLSPPKGVPVADREISISQQADDTALFFKEASQVSAALRRTNMLLLLFAQTSTQVSCSPSNKALLYFQHPRKRLSHIPSNYCQQGPKQEVLTEL